MTLIAEACNEFNVNLWIGMINFEKAFDTIEHDTLWAALADQGVPSAYIDLMKRLYAGQTAT
eukprot:690061-Pyramimonas_sp.AAC.1